MKLTPVAALEAILFVSPGPLSRKRVCTVLDIPEKELSQVVDALREELVGRGLSLVEAKEGLELRTAPDTAPYVKKLRENELSRDLGRAGLETLATILYKNGATRSEIDWIRGVNSSATVRSLLLRGLIERTEDTADRRKIRYELTTEALAHLGLSSTKEAPGYDELVHALTESEQKETEPETEQSV